LVYNKNTADVFKEFRSMQRMIGPDGWEQLTELKKQLTPDDRNKIKELSTQENFQGLTDFINIKLYKLVKKKCEADLQASNILHEFDAQKDGEALKNFFDDSAIFQKIKESIVSFNTEKTDFQDLQNFINQLSLKEIKNLQRNRTLGMYLGIFGISLGLFIINFFIKTAHVVSLGKLGRKTLDFPDGYYKNLSDYKDQLVRLSLPKNTSIQFDDKTVAYAMLLIPEVEDEKPTNLLTRALDISKGSMIPDLRKLQTRWQKAIFVLLMAAALTAIIMFPYILGPLAGFAAGVTITAIFTKVSIAYTVTKIAAFILDPIIVRVFETSDDQEAKQVISFEERVLKPEDKPKNSHKKMNEALPKHPQFAATSAVLSSQVSSRSPLRAGGGTNPENGNAHTPKQSLKKKRNCSPVGLATSFRTQ
jgi:hypothetical protein